MENEIALPTNNEVIRGAGSLRIELLSSGSREPRILFEGHLNHRGTLFAASLDATTLVSCFLRGLGIAAVAAAILEASGTRIAPFSWGASTSIAAPSPTPPKTPATTPPGTAPAIPPTAAVAVLTTIAEPLLTSTVSVTVATSSRTSSLARSYAFNAKVSREGRKPGLDTKTWYVPWCKRTCRKFPESSASAVRVVPVMRLVAVTKAPLIAAPVWSSTVPEISMRPSGTS